MDTKKETKTDEPCPLLFSPPKKHEDARRHRRRRKGTGPGPCAKAAPAKAAPGGQENGELLPETALLEATPCAIPPPPQELTLLEPEINFRSNVNDVRRRIHLALSSGGKIRATRRHGVRWSAKKMITLIVSFRPYKKLWTLLPSFRRHLGSAQREPI
ncbi:Hypothetical predicted protein [Cloeon dipterum]|uniref:Uncharacterized protein n=1 Tax=Cloeon dipterum TaxID=197152 RepID=A0A8S1DUD6_9INSE|nr:Hypothetical predicted protein [Cloeon dipterum]